MEKVSKGMMNKLNYVRSHTLEYQTTPLQFLDNILEGKYVEISEWYLQQRYLAEAQFKLIEHVFGDTPQFEEEKSKKYIVRSKKADMFGNFRYLNLGASYGLPYTVYGYIDNISEVAKFNTREEADEWTNPMTEVVEVEE
ncbi:hypothetical protein K3977_02925 [Weissella viridescens]|uniref:hypothetical protein n=1 Tax=Weissella viridescens TaxID=1629 RepID=UPI001C7CFA50|nr:hypothetical protein [Weissella viridescens]MBX4172576.1 hypothetical protein [Weissella viridescens]